MKKILTLSLLLLGSGIIRAEALQIFSLGEGTPGIDEPQLMGLGISPNGRYVCGAVEMGSGIFVADCASGGVKWSMAGDAGGELRHIDNSGVAIGFTDSAVLYSYSNDEVTDLKIPAGVKYILGESLTNDGSMLVGSLVIQGFNTQAAYTTDREEWICLPFPAEEEMEKLNLQTSVSAAKQVSGDGKVILGYLGSFAAPLVWVKNSEDDYIPDYFPVRYLKADSPELDDPSKELYSISGMYTYLSNNGRYVALMGLIYDEDLREKRSILVVYDVYAKKMKLYKEHQDIDPDCLGLYPLGISDNGTIIGTIGQPMFGSAGSFILKAGSNQAETYVDAFPVFNEKLGEGDRVGLNSPSGISADGRFISGYIYYADDYYTNDGEAAYYLTYVIDRGEDADVSEISAENPVKGTEEIYSMDGIRRNSLSQGINIVRRSDGTVTKIYKK